MKKRLLSVTLILAMVLTVTLFSKNKAGAYYGGYSTYGSLDGGYGTYGGLGSGYAGWVPGGTGGGPIIIPGRVNALSPQELQGIETTQVFPMGSQYSTYGGLDGSLYSGYSAYGNLDGGIYGGIFVPQTFCWDPVGTPDGPIIVPHRVPSPPEPSEIETTPVVGTITSPVIPVGPQYPWYDFTITLPSFPIYPVMPVNLQPYWPTVWPMPFPAFPDSTPIPW